MSHTYNHPAAAGPEQLLVECDVQRVRRSGPGGQHRNKVETGVVLLHRPTGVKAEANERRSQVENRSVALRRLRANLALEVRRPCSADFEPSVLWRSRCRGGRIVVARTHEDFPAVLAEALDVIDANNADTKNAAALLGCTASQLIKLLKQEPRAMALVNGWRAQRGLRPMRS